MSTSQSLLENVTGALCRALGCGEGLLREQLQKGFGNFIEVHLFYLDCFSFLAVKFYVVFSCPSKSPHCQFFICFIPNVACQCFLSFLGQNLPEILSIVKVFSKNQPFMDYIC